MTHRTRQRGASPLFPHDEAQPSAQDRSTADDDAAAAAGHSPAPVADDRVAAAGAAGARKQRDARIRRGLRGDLVPRHAAGRAVRRFRGRRRGRTGRRDRRRLGRTECGGIGNALVGFGRWRHGAGRRIGANAPRPPRLAARTRPPAARVPRNRPRNRRRDQRRRLPDGIRRGNCRSGRDRGTDGRGRCRARARHHPAVRSCRRRRTLGRRVHRAAARAARPCAARPRRCAHPRPPAPGADGRPPACDAAARAARQQRGARCRPRAGAQLPPEAGCGVPGAAHRIRRA